MNGQLFTFDVNGELHKIRENADIIKISSVRGVSSDPCESVKMSSTENRDEISNFSRISSASPDSQVSDEDKIEEIKQLIRTYARYWKETEESTEQYIKEQLATFPLDDLLNCFRLLNEEIPLSQRHPANVADVANLEEG